MKKVKYILCCIVVAVIGCSIWGTAITRAAGEPVEEFEIVDNKLLEYRGKDKVVTVPDGVRCIGEGALSFYYTTSDVEVILPDSVEEIEDYAIYGKNLKKITVGNGLKKIGNKGMGIDHIHEYYLDPFGDSDDIEMDWANSSLRIYGPKDSIARDYAEGYGFIYNDNVSCRLDKKELHVMAKTTDALRLWWDVQHCVDGYYIYRSETRDGSYEKIGEIKQERGPEQFYTDRECEIGKKYYYQVRAYRNDELNNKLLVSDTALQGSGTTRLPQVEDGYAAVRTISSLEISWDPVVGTQTYVILRSEKEEGIYKKLATVKTSVKYEWRKNNRIKYVDKNLKLGKTYYYIVKAVDLKNPLIDGYSSESFSGKVGLGEVKNFKAVKKSSGGYRLSWSKQPECTGYIIYRLKDDAGAKQERLAVIKNRNTQTYTDKTAKKGTNYYYYIKPYLYQNGKRYTGRVNTGRVS